MRSIVLLLLGAHLAYAGTHSLRYFYTGVSGDIDFPEFTAVGLVDDGQFMYFDSNTKKAVPKTEWIRQNVGEDYWDIENQNLIPTHQSFKNNIQVAKERFNQSKGVHTSQLMYGCELDDDGNKRGYYQYGYDGEDFLSLDKSSHTWTAANPQAFTTKIKWDSTKAHAEFQNNYLSNTCIEWLKKYVNYGKDTLDRKVSPQVSLLQKDPSSPVTCHATGFYPSGVTITWMKNGREHYEDVDLGELLPNEDGTFQKTSTIRVTPDERKKNEFSCVVEHQGKTIRIILTEKEIRTNSNGNSAPVSTTVVFANVIASLVVIGAIGITGFVVYVRKNKSASKTSTVDSAESLISSKTSTVDSAKSLISSDILNDDSTKSLTYLNSNPDPGYSSAPDNDSHSGSDSGSDNVSV